MKNKRPLSTIEKTIIAVVIIIVLLIAIALYIPNAMSGHGDFDSQINLLNKTVTLNVG